jgi:hypothetical protein
VDLYSGGAARGSPSQSMVVARDGSGAFSAQFDPVSGGTYTVAARQSDAAGNTGSSTPVSFTVAGAGGTPTPPAFAVMAMDESIADAAGGRLTTLSSCEDACSRSASLTVSSRTAAKLGLPRRGSAPVRLGGGSTSAGAGAVKVGLSRRVRRALGRSHGTKATLAATAGPVSLARAITLRPKLSPARVASHGLKLAGICSSHCTIATHLIVSGSGARRLGLRSGGRSVAVGSARIDSSGTARTFTVRIARSVRRALSRARAADLTLEVIVSAPNTASRRATRRITLG